MTHIRLDDGFGEHPKIVRLSDRALRLYINGLCYCSRRETDGFISAPALAFLLKGNVGRLTVELEQANLWEVAQNGWIVHDYLKHQRSKADIDAQRETARERMNRWRGHAVTTANERRTNSEVTRREEETEEEVREKEPSSSRARNARQWYEKLTGHKATGAMRQILEDIDVAHPAECVVAAFTAAADKGDGAWPYAKRVLDSCFIEGHQPRRNANGRNRSGSKTKPAEKPWDYE